MFTKARLKLTAWYLMILLIVGGLFSAVIYRVMTFEVRQGYLQAESRLRSRERELGLPAPVEIREQLLADFDDSRKRIIGWLLLANGVILVFSAGASFLLAGKTLEPIQIALEEQKRFVADASHELHTPLTALKTSMEVALREKKLTESEMRQLLKENLEEIDELATLNENMLSLAKFEKKGDVLFPMRVDVGDVTQTISKRMTPLAKKKHITLNIQAENQVVMIDEVQLTKLITILVDNAIKYTPEKGVVSLQATKEGKNLVVTVSDTGIGIAKSDMPHLFDRFFRADLSRTKGDIDGFGLGLAIAKRIVDLNRGTIDVKSKIDEGTTFIVILPIEIS